MGDEESRVDRAGKVSGGSLIWFGFNGILAAALLLFPTLFFWMGVTTAVGRGDPTWNDGEQTWATALGLVTTLMVCGIVWLLVSWTGRSCGWRLGGWNLALLVLPSLVLEAALSGMVWA
ncbi:hypothetical protein ACTQ49_14180 [Luteococcus sp. Sow4_B9]|uniref:hypothetical protein n=1 Tax=Luteococcus sp. Sow4_B9 TaxID=3438792 RepID=UPI003F95A00B